MRTLNVLSRVCVGSLWGSLDHSQKTGYFNWLLSIAKRERLFVSICQPLVMNL